MKRGRTPKRHEAQDGTVSWRVRYRSATGAQKSETFYDESMATEFAKLLDALGPARAIDYIDQREKDGTGRAHTLTVADLFDKWMAYKSKRDRNGELVHVRSERTLLDYQRMYDARIKAAFGAKPANLVSQIDVQSWVDDLSDELAPKTIAAYHSLLHAIYGWGIHPNRGLVVVDPCSETTLPKRRKKPPKGLRPQEWQILNRAARQVDDDAADLVLFLVSTGWRWSEAVAARVMDVDHYGIGQTWITMGRVLRREGNHYVFVDDAKSDAGSRRIRLTGEAEAMVLRRIEGRAPGDLILTAPRGGRWHYPTFHKRYWSRPAKGKDDAPNRKRILEVARDMGLDRPDITPHWLRHTHVGLLILAGEPLPAIQRRIGHANITTTVDTYGKMVEDISDAGLGRLAALLDGTTPPAIEN